MHGSSYSQAPRVADSRWIRYFHHRLRVSLIAMCVSDFDIFDFFVIVNFSFAENDFGNCERVVKTWTHSSLDREVIHEDKHTLRDLLFFLHVPRTGGRTYFHW